MNGKETNIKPEERLIALSEKIIKQLKVDCPSENQRSNRIIAGNKNPKITEALVVFSDGEWSFRVFKGNVSLGKNPPLNILLSVYADLNDEKYPQMSKSEREVYLELNKEKLTEGLLTQMETVSNFLLQ
jgi:hypothetical protein